MANLLGTTVSGNIYVSGYSDVNPTNGSFRFYDGSTFRGGFGLNSWAFGGGSSNDLNLYVANDSTLYISTNGVNRHYFNSGEAAFKTYGPDQNYKISILGGDQLNAYYGSGAATLYLQYHGNAGGDIRIAGNKFRFDNSNSKLIFQKSTGTIISHGSMDDAIGWNSDYGTYIGSTVGGTSYLYANGTLYTEGVHRTLIHSGNIGSQSVSYADESGYSGSTGSVEWTNVNSRPTALSQFTNDLTSFVNRIEFQYNTDRYSQAWRNTNTGAYWWVTTDDDKLGLHRNGDGDKFYFGNGGDFWSSANGWLSTALSNKQNASTAITTSNWSSYAAPRAYIQESFVDFTIYGDQNTYYPVTIHNYNGSFSWQRYSIHRGYSDTAPWNPIGTGVHQGGLTFAFEWAGDIAWGGNDKSIRVIEFNETYTQMVAGMQLAHCEGVVVWLRGGGTGGAYYRLHGPGGRSQGYTINMSNWTSCAGVTYEPRDYNGDTVNSEINSRYPIRGNGNGDIFVSNQAVIHSGNIGSQSVNYASSAGNSSTTSQRDFSGDISTSGMGRFAGWYNGNAQTGLAVEIGVSSGQAYIIAYNRQTSSYGTLNLESSGTNLRISGSTVNVTSGTLQQGGNNVIHSGNIASQSVNYADESGYSASSGSVEWANVQNKPSTFPPSTHNHDDRYFTETESDSRFFFAQSSQLANTDLNNLTTRGVYYSADQYGTNTNIPFANYFTMINLTNDVGRQAQLWFGDTPGSAYWRARQGDSTGWHPWEKLITSNNIGSQSVNYAASAGNADTVDGFHASVAGTANTIPTRNANGYLIPENWIQLNGIYGLYSPTNDAHLRPNNANYGSWLVTGTRNGWRGLEFDSGSAGNVSLMVSNDSNTSGFHNNSYGWQIRWANGTLYVGKGSYGGGTDATVLDSSNYSSWAQPASTAINTGNIGSQIVQGLGTTFLGNGTSNIGDGYSRVIRNENGLGGNLNYAPILHLAASDTMWQIAAGHGGSTNLLWRSGYAGTWNTPWWNIMHSGLSSYEYANNMNQYVRTTDNVTFNTTTAPTILVNNHSDNTRGYRIHNTSGSSVSAMFTNSANALVIGAGAFDQVQLNKKVLVSGAALGVNVAASATAGRIDASNDIVAYSSSDERLKHNITPIENALDKVKSLTGVEFDWKPEYKHAHGHEGHDTGIIAQQVQEVIPSAVRTNDTGFLAVRYEKLIGLLIEANKELAARVEELEKKLG
jgi:hypothetical protein